jgi:hypothetical protein
VYLVYFVVTILFRLIWYNQCASVFICGSHLG